MSDLDTTYFRLPDILTAAGLEGFDGLPISVKVKNALQNITKSKLVVSPFQVKYATQLKIEETLVNCWSATNEARAASLDWLTLTTSVESLKSSVHSLAAEIEQLSKWRQLELDELERALLGTIESTEKYADADAQKADNYQEIVKTFFDVDSRNKLDQGAMTVGNVSFKRDPLPGVAAPWANTVDTAFNFFASGQPMFKQATAAQAWQQQRSVHLSEMQLTHQIQEVKSAQLTTMSTIGVLKSQLATIDQQRNSAISAVTSLRYRHSVALSRLESTQFDWDRRAAGLLNRYSSAIVRLQIYGRALLACIANLFPDRLSRAEHEQFAALIDLSSDSLGKQLDDVSVFLNNLDSLLRAEAFASKASEISVLVQLPLDGTTKQFEVKISDYAWASKALLRGLSFTVLGADQGLCQGWVKPPEVGAFADKDAKGNIVPREINQQEVGECSLGILRLHSFEKSDAILTQVQLWNCSPFGVWGMRAKKIKSSAISCEVLLTFYLQYQTL